MSYQKGAISMALVFLMIGFFGAIGYIAYQKIPGISQTVPNLTGSNTSSFKVSENVVPSVIDRWLPDVSWEDPKVGVYKLNLTGQGRTGFTRKGVVINSKLTRTPYEPNIETQIKQLGWNTDEPLDTPGIFEKIYTYSKEINGKKKYLVITVKITDNVDRVKPPYKNSITVFQEN